MQKQIDPKTIKALALDLDGTALKPDSTLGGRTVKCLKALAAGGIQIIFCTGRPVEAAEQYRTAVGAEGPMVYFNGAVVADLPSGRVLSAALLNLEAVDFGIDLARSMGLHYQFFIPAGVNVRDGTDGAGGNKRETLVAGKLTQEGEMYCKRTGITPLIMDMKEAIAVPGLRGCVKAMFICDRALHDEIRKKLLDRFGNSIYIAQTSPTFLEIMTAGVSKGEGLKTVMKHRGLKAGEVIAFGDEENDLLMFDAAGFSAAPANARENVKKAAGYVFGSNAEEGMAAFLEELFMIK